MSETIENKKELKEKIRERYKGIDSDELDVIPALPEESFYDETRTKRVGVYARVSTDDPRQTSSYELQKNHYQDMVSRRPDWELVRIYADEGISGTSLKNRDAFIQMIKDCEDKKLDLIITKSVSRFARNVVDCIGYVRLLANMNPPIGVFFETENIYTLNSNAEMSLSFISTLAQEESHTKSEIMNASIEMRFRRGIFLTPVLLGFDHDEDGELVVNPNEALIVRLCFLLYYSGWSSSQIAEKLKELKCKSKKGNIIWNPGTVISLLQNERYCGDVLSRKTWTPNYLDHKSKKNRQDRNQYRKRDHHEAIVSRDMFIAVQHMISNRKYGSQSLFPNLNVISDGNFKGFVSMNPRWTSFKKEDYQDASFSVGTEPEQIQSSPSVSEKMTTLGNYEVSRGSFFITREVPFLTINRRRIRFSMQAIKGLEFTPYIEAFIHPGKLQLLIRTSNKDERNAIRWIHRSSKDKWAANSIPGAAFIPMLFSLCSWDLLKTYQIRGTTLRSSSGPVILFNLSDITEIKTTAFGQKTDYNNLRFGNSLLESSFEYSEDNNLFHMVPYSVSDISVPDYTKESINIEIDSIIEKIKKGNADDGIDGTTEL